VAPAVQPQAAMPPVAMPPPVPPPAGSRSAQGPGAVPAPEFTPTKAPVAPATGFLPPLVIFQPPEISQGATAGQRPAGAPDPVSSGPGGAADRAGAEPADRDGDDGAAAGAGKRRRRGGRSHAKGRGGAGDDADAGAEPAVTGPDDGEGAQASTGRRRAAAAGAADDDADEDNDEDNEDGTGAPARRRRRRRRSGSAAESDSQAPDDPPNTVVHVRTARAAAADASSGDVKGVRGSTRLEAKRQRRREGRESGRRRPPIITESEFLARREAVDRLMVVRQTGERTQIAVLEDGVLVEHYVDKASHQSYVGNVYLGKVQNVLPSMEAAFVDIGKGRNAVLYAGEVNFDASGLEGESKRIESALKSGQSILVQATKDPIGHKGARLTSQVSLPGRYLVYVPGAGMTGISRKLPDTERARLKQILKKVMPENAGVIVRTAAEGATEEELAQDVARLSAQWEAIEQKAKTATAPELLYSEPDLTIRVVRDIFNEDFASLVISSDSEWDMVEDYVRYVAPHLADRLSRWDGDQDVFAAYRIDEQIAKALDRKVWLPSGGSLVIDATEAMTVIDVNTGKFTGHGGNLEQTVTRNNLEAAEEIVRQLRVRDVGGIIVIDFIDMVLESNRDLVLRRLLECLARDRTKHQVAEVTSLGLVQMTRKRVGSGLLEAFSVPCEHCNGRGVLISLEPVDHTPASPRALAGDGDRQSGGDGQARNGRRGGRGSGRGRKSEHAAVAADMAEIAAGKPAAAADAHAGDNRAGDTQARDSHGGDSQTGDTGHVAGAAGAADVAGAAGAAVVVDPANAGQAADAVSQAAEPEAAPAARASKPAGPVVTVGPVMIGGAVAAGRADAAPADAGRADPAPARAGSANGAPADAEAAGARPADAEAADAEPAETKRPATRRRRRPAAAAVADPPVENGDAGSGSGPAGGPETREAPAAAI
jgi:ribonuclease E